MRIIVIGDGGWGTAFALTAIESGHKVGLFSFFPDYSKEMEQTRDNKKFLPGFPLPDSLALSNIEKLPEFESVDCIVNAVPTQFVRESFARVSSYVKKGIPIISLSKGLEIKTSKRISEVLSELLPENPLMVLSGPSHAEEVAKKLPTVVTLAGEGDKIELGKFRNELSNHYFRIYSNDDLIGAELGGALKNVIGLAAGMVDGLDYGDNTKSALITRGLVEIVRFGEALGAKRETFYGLSGLGDLITTSVSGFGRNWWFGREIGRGRKKDEILRDTEKVVEGIFTVQAVMNMVRENHVEMPICEKVFEVVFNGLSPEEGLLSLMNRDYKKE